MGTEKLKVLYEADFASMELKVMASMPAFDYMVSGKAPHYVWDRDGTPREEAGHLFSFFDGGVLVTLEVISPKSISGHYGTPKDELEIRVGAQYPGYMSVAKKYKVKVPKETYESDLEKWRIAGVVLNPYTDDKHSQYGVTLCRGITPLLGATEPVKATLSITHSHLLEDAPNHLWLGGPLPLVQYEPVVGYVVFRNGKPGPFSKYKKGGETNYHAASLAAKGGSKLELWAVTEAGEKHTLIKSNTQTAALSS